jgi:hypothetical protein
MNQFLYFTVATRLRAGWSVTDKESCAITSNIDGFACEVGVKCAPRSAILHPRPVSRYNRKNTPPYNSQIWNGNYLEIKENMLAKILDPWAISAASLHQSQ